MSQLVVGTGSCAFLGFIILVAITLSGVANGLFCIV